MSGMAPENGEHIKNYAIRVDEKLRDINASIGFKQAQDADSTSSDTITPQANVTIAEGNKKETERETERVEATNFNKSTQNSQYPCSICRDKATRPHTLRNCFYNPNSDKWNIDLQKEDQKRRREAASARKGRKRQKKEDS